LGINFEYGSIFIQSVSVQNVKKSNPKCLSVELSRLRVDAASYSLCRAYLRKGFSFTYAGFNTPVLGHGIVVSAFMEPIYRIGNKLQFQFRGDIGASYLTSPFDSVRNPSNQNYSLHFTPYLHFATGLGYPVTPRLTAAVNVNMHHFSNGNFKQPNAGVNLFMLSFSLLYYPEKNILPKYHIKINRNWIASKPVLDVGWMFVLPQSYVSKSKAKRHYMTGLFAQVSKQVSPIDALTFGAEVCYNNFTNGPGALLNNSKPALLSGINFGHEFLMGKLIFSQQLGMYVTQHPTFYSNLYHRWGLRYKLSRHWQAGFNMKAHGKTADLIDLRLQYSF
jgi:Lipid A 3-O-deacylase (PagL)